MKYNTDACTLEMSVAELCAIAAGSGDIGAPRYDIRADLDMASIRARLQSEAGAYYNAEVPLSCTVCVDGLYYTVSGVADGIIRTKDGLAVDILRCVRGRAFFDIPRDSLLAELKCISYFLCLREELDGVCARVTYYNADTKKIKYFRYRFMLSELNEFFFSLIDAVKCRAVTCAERENDILPRAASAVFPYKELREGQEIMIRECYSAIKKGKRLFVEAPTGTGKTISSLFPAVRALGNGVVDKIFYLTAKASTRREAFRAAADIYKSGVHLRTIVISAKEQACVCSARMLPHSLGSLCNGRDCAFARGYYERVRGAIDELLQGYNGYTAQLIHDTAKKYGVCPYELSLDLSEYCDIIICDYNYAFDPSVYFRRYFSGERNEKYAFLIDEAHNLVDRARDTYSAILSRNSFERAIEELSVVDTEPTSMCQTAVRAFSQMRSLCGETLVKEADGEERGYGVFNSPLEKFNSAMELFKKKSEAWLKKNKDHERAYVIAELLQKVRRFLLVCEFFDKGFLTYVQLYGGDVTVQTVCTDPSSIMSALLLRAHASVFFSATLTPTDYFCSLLGGGKKAKCISLPSPFAPENLCVAVADYVSSRYEGRDSNISRFATVIAAAVSSKKGNYIAYFPSYSCLEQTLAAFKRKYPKVETVVQERNMSYKDKENFLSAFKDDENYLRVGFCVLGGAFAEGVDLPGSRLIGSIIFGVGLPALSNERNMIRDHADPDGNEGYDYAYTYPGMNNVLQAAGRVIRRDSDRGIVILADDRYATPKYRELFPEHWKNVQYAGNAKSLAELVRRFWNDGE